MNKIHNKYERCPCNSNLLYHKCCQPYHAGALPPDALALMRSRYSAYELNLPDYIMDTTHPEHPEYMTDRNLWKGDLASFSRHTRFDRLKILEFVDGEESATVSFTAYLRQADKDASFTEKSTFIKENGKWFYRSGEMPDIREGQ